ncbi:MAG: hypothetical protein JSW71_15945 [Gemmatimonadota bacterium]|nr:MAG: hypothetical protein JSW71_15945 [Gemmatimonadota bacterium]
MTASAGRRFGLTLGFAFMALGAVLLWRDHRAVAAVAGAVGITLVVSGIVIPTMLGPVERGWMALAHAISRVTTPILMWLVYYVTIFPIGAIMRMLRRNPLARTGKGNSFWLDRESRNADHMTHQF